MTRRIESFREFWPYYLNQHRRPTCRALHYAGTSATLTFIGSGIAAEPWLLLLTPAGYVPSWIGHFFIEKNRPATFGHPLWAVIADVKMFALALVGRLKPQLAEAARIHEDLPRC